MVTFNLCGILVQSTPYGGEIEKSRSEKSSAKNNNIPIARSELRSSDPDGGAVQRLPT